MKKTFSRHSGVAAPLLIDNIDTDQIIPSREMKTVSKEGLGEGLFAGWRYTEVGGREPNQEFVLNQNSKIDSTILIAGSNFGCGSSREHAVWALSEYGIRVILAVSFGEIFHANCLRNGILAVSLSQDNIDALANASNEGEITVDLVEQTVSAASIKDWKCDFEIGAYPKKMLMEGLCPIEMTLTNEKAIDAFLQVDKETRPWVYTV
ncbi:3-isopropylmalate dehydratase small subunit [Hirschia maritima]|uniref:3-isopropylmalate dehydratase small subunit n=1 Tax=Hirschia maritima TaxID=1121961 RepID=UPI0003706035|nr:3-isopropylmalate dehydratase small subunit [Hirschia maritima]